MNKVTLCHFIPGVLESEDFWIGTHDRDTRRRRVFALAPGICVTESMMVSAYQAGREIVPLDVLQSDYSLN